MTLENPQSTKAGINTSLRQIVTLQNTCWSLVRPIL